MRRPLYGSLHYLFIFLIFFLKFLRGWALEVDIVLEGLAFGVLVVIQMDLVG